jgi:hypothetical protein
MADLQTVNDQARLVAALRELVAVQEEVLRAAALEAHRNGEKIAAVSRAAAVSRPTFYGWMEAQSG